MVIVCWEDVGGVVGTFSIGGLEPLLFVYDSGFSWSDDRYDLAWSCQYTRLFHEALLVFRFLGIPSYVIRQNRLALNAGEHEQK